MKTEASPTNFEKIDDAREKKTGNVSVALDLYVVINQIKIIEIC